MVFALHGEKRFQKINNEAFAIITKKSFDEHFIEIFTLKYNEIIFSIKFLVPRYILNLDNDTFVITPSGFIDIFKIEDKKVNKITSQSMDKPNYFEFVDQLEFQIRIILLF